MLGHAPSHESSDTGAMSRAPVLSDTRARPGGWRPAWRRAVLVAGSVCAVASAPARVDAQATARSATSEAPRLARRASGSADSASLLRRVRAAQAAFERRRRALLPIGWAGDGRCDVRIGRFCYWYDEGTPDGPPEPARVGVERARLLAVLDDVAVELPADPWVVGQLVRYHVDAGHADSAVAAARRCAADARWCAALRGLAHHAAGHAPAADSAFAAARALLTEAERCRRADLSVLLDGPTRRRWGALSCAARDSLAERWWWLATPFFSRGGNDRRNEHEARLVLAQLHAEARTPYADGWRDDLDELLVRYGWPERWSRRAPTAAAPGEISIVGHDPSPAYRFAPLDARLAAPYASPEDDWPLRDPHAVERYAPDFARRLHELPAAAAALRRGDSLLVLVDYQTPPDPSLGRAGQALALVLARHGESPLVTRDSVRASAAFVAASAPGLPHLASLEILGDSAHAARARFAVRPPPLVDGFGMSDVVLFDGSAVPAQPPDSTSTAVAPAVALADVLAAPLASLAVRAPGAIGVYWELYGLPDGPQAVETSLVVAGEEPGWLARTWERVRGEPPRSPVRLHWTDVGSGGAVAARSMMIALPALPAGRYALELRAKDGRGRTVAARRALTVRAR